MKIIGYIIINSSKICSLLPCLEPRWVRFYSNKVVKPYDNSLLNKELMVMEWKIFIIKIMIIFFLYIISIISLDIIIPIFSYAFRIIMGDIIMCADMSGSEEPLNTEDANTYIPYLKEEMKDDVKVLGEVCLEAANLLIGGATVKTFVDAATGDIPEAGAAALTAIGGITAKGLIKMGVNEACRKIDKIPDNHSVDEPISPGNEPDSLS